MKDFIQKHSTSIIVAILSTMIFLYLLKPILDYIGSVVIQIGTILGAAYVDEIYTQISYLEIRDQAFLLSLTLHGSMAAATMMIAVLIWWHPKRINKKPTDSDDSPKVSTQTKVSASVILVTVSLVLTTTIATQWYQLTLITSFKQYSRILAPYMTEQQEEELLSQWSLIKSAEDFDLVNEKVHNIANDNNIELPEHRLYSLTTI